MAMVGGRLLRRPGRGAAARDGLQALARAHERRSRRRCAPAWPETASAAPAQDEIVQGIKSFALYGFPESHAASFALLAYASAYLKAHHPAAFTARCSTTGRWASITRRRWSATPSATASRRGRSTSRAPGWRCDVEDGGRALRLGLRYVAGLREEIGRRIEAARAAAPFASLADFAARAQAERSASWRRWPRSARWRRWAGRGGRRCGRSRRSGESGALFARVSGRSDAGAAPLPEMTADEEIAADLRRQHDDRPAPDRRSRAPRSTGAASRAPPISRASPTAARARMAGVVIVRQRPGTAKGFVFITLEDETGFANAIVTPQRFAAARAR